MRLLMPRVIRRNPVQFLTDDELFYRPHSAAWAMSDGRLHVLRAGIEHDWSVDWEVWENEMYTPRADAEAAMEDLDMTTANYVMFTAHWIAVGNPFFGRTHHPVAEGAWQALAFFLASAAIWFARKGMNLLDADFHLFSDRSGMSGKADVILQVGDIISRHAAPGVEEAMYAQLSRYPHPKKLARYETGEERLKRTGSRR